MEISGEGCNYPTEMATDDKAPVKSHRNKQNWTSSKQHTFTDILSTHIGNMLTDTKNSMSALGLSELLMLFVILGCGVNLV